MASESEAPPTSPIVVLHVAPDVAARSSAASEARAWVERKGMPALLDTDEHAAVIKFLATRVPLTHVHVVGRAEDATAAHCIVVRAHGYMFDETERDADWVAVGSIAYMDPRSTLRLHFEALDK